MAHVNRIATAVFDAFFSVMVAWPAWASLFVISALTGVIALLAYKYTSNQDAIHRVHNDIRVSLLAAKLFKDNIRVTLSAQGRLFVSAGKLFLLSLQPLAVMTIPMVLLIAQMAPRYEWQPLRPGDEISLYANVNEKAPEQLADLAIVAPPGVQLLAKPANYFVGAFKDNPQEHYVHARLRVDAPGRYHVTVKAAGASAQKELVVSERPQDRMSPMRPGDNFWDQLLYAVEPPAGESDVIQKIWIEPVRPGVTKLFGIDLHWIIWWLILSMIVALIIKPFLNVQMW